MLPPLGRRIVEALIRAMMRFVPDSRASKQATRLTSSVGDRDEEICIGDARLFQRIGTGPTAVDH